MLMNARPSLSLPEWTVLTVLSQQPTHGFAVAQLTARHGELGRIWQIPRPVVYRAIGRLMEAGLVRPESVQPGLGPQRTIYAATPQGREAAERWLDTPVEHIRDICADCPVRPDCLELSLRHAFDIGAHGVWGGLVEGERRALRRQWLAGTRVTEFL